MKEAIKEFLQKQEIENYQHLNKWLTDYLESAQIQKHIFLSKFDKDSLKEFQKLLNLFKEGKHSELEQLFYLDFPFLSAEQTKKPHLYFGEWMQKPDKGLQGYSKNTASAEINNIEGVNDGNEKSFDVLWVTNSTPLSAVNFVEKNKVLKQQSLTHEGIKHNQDKLEMSRLFEQFPNALKAIVECSTYGAKKYNEKEKWDNFRSVKGGSKTYIDALVRHLADGWDNKDTESNLHHIAHIAWNALAALELFLDSACTDKK